MGLFEQYGIKEVADVTLYSIHKKKDGSGDIYYVPALYLDTLKVSTVEKSAESVWAQGGLGNARLIAWDYGKEINVTLEDALCTPASLGLCWNGILSADWKDAEVQFNTDVCCCKNPLTKISRMEKAFFPRQSREDGVISRLLPQLKRDTESIDALDLLKISSVVDGTNIRGTGICHNHSYRWKMAIESRVKSIAVVPDRFFDIKGRSYRIDWDRKVSAASLPTYINYKDAVIYRINKCRPCVAPPLAKIIFDYNMESQYTVEDLSLTNQPVSLDTKENGYTFATLLNKNGYNVYENGAISSNNQYYIPIIDLGTRIMGTVQYKTTTDTSGNEVKTDEKTGQSSYSIPDSYKKAYKVKQGSELEKQIKEVLIKVDNLDLLDSTLVNYLQNAAMTELFDEENGKIKDIHGSIYTITDTLPIIDAQYLAIIVDSNDEYHALVGNGMEYDTNGDLKASAKISWYKPETPVDVFQFKGIDMWLRFQSINEMIYFMITKYEDDIIDIIPSTIISSDEKEWSVSKAYTTVSQDADGESRKAEGKLWAYVNPRTMKPYDDDYWFHQGEPYYVKSLTMAPKGKILKGQRITVKADQWPGMYMMVGETYIRDRDTGKDERMQIKFPLCKVKSDHSLTLQADGDPTTFNLDLEVARPASGVMMELTSYEIAEKLLEGDNGCFYAVDGSTEVLSE